MTLPERIKQAQELENELRELAEKATPGDWWVDGPPNNQIIWSAPEIRVCFMSHSDGKDSERDIATAALIVALRNSLPTILAALAERDKMREALEALVQQCHDCEKELTESYYGTEFTGESLPLCNARKALGESHE